jgi:hypothetical protein
LITTKMDRGVPNLASVEGKGKAVPVNVVKAYVELEAYLHLFLTSALDRFEWSTSRLGRFTPRGKELFCTLNKGLDGPQRWAEKSFALAGMEPGIFEPVAK